MLKDCHIHGFVVLFLLCILRYSVLVDSYACDEIPWQEPRKKQPPSLLPTTKKKVEQATTTGSASRTQQESAVFLTLDDARIL